MVNSILQYIEPQLKAYMQFLNRVDSPVFRISNGEMIKGNGQEKEVVTISDLNGNSLYIRQTQPETINERKALSSCDKEYNISARCKLVFYTFGGNDFTINPDKVKSKIINTLASLDFSHYSGSSTEIKIDVNGTSLDIEKIYTEETGKDFTGNVWPTLVSVDFTLSYVDTNCNTCDIDDSETVVTWTPDLTPENCETKAICEVISKCDVITLLQEQTASLQEQIDNLPQSGLTCTDLPNCQTIIDILQSINDIISGLPSSYFSCADLEFCQTIIDIVSDISALQTQVGTNTTDISTLQGQVSSLISDLGTLTTTVNNHISDTSNPHNVTLEQARYENSSISGDINANNNTIINLKDAVNPQEPITKIQFDTYVSAVGGNRGAIDCSTNPNYPASNQGDRWEVTVAGKIGGPSGINVDVYDEIVCVAASASGDQATVGVNFYIVQGNIERATETTNGYTSYATDAEVQAGTNNTKTITPLKLYNWFVALVQSVFVKKGTLTTNYIPKATASDTIGDSQIFDDGTNVGIGTASPTAKLDVNGNIKVFNTLGDNDLIELNSTSYGTNLKKSINFTDASASVGKISNVFNGSETEFVFGSLYNSGYTSANVMKINGSGNVLISEQNLAMNGVNSSKLRITTFDNSSNYFGLKIDDNYLNPLFNVRNDGLINIGGLTPSQIVETDASKNLVSAAKGTAYNKNFGTTTGTVLEGNRISQTITNGVIDKAPSEDVVFDSLALKAPIASPTFTGQATSPSVVISGTGGNGFIDLQSQSSDPSAPSSGIRRLFNDALNKLSFGMSNGMKSTYRGKIYSDLSTSSALTGTTSNTLMKAGLIKGGTFNTSATDTIRIEALLLKTGTGAACMHRIYVNTSASLSGARLLATTGTGATITFNDIVRNGIIKSATNTQVFSNGTVAGTDEGLSGAGGAGGVNSVNIDWTVDQYIIQAAQLGINTDSVVSSFLKVYRE